MPAASRHALRRGRSCTPRLRDVVAVGSRRPAALPRSIRAARHDTRRTGPSRADARSARSVASGVPRRRRRRSRRRPHRARRARAYAGASRRSCAWPSAPFARAFAHRTVMPGAGCAARGARRTHALPSRICRRRGPGGTATATMWSGRGAPSLPLSPRDGERASHEASRSGHAARAPHDARPPGVPGRRCPSSACPFLPPVKASSLRFERPLLGAQRCAGHDQDRGAEDRSPVRSERLHEERFYELALAR